MQHILVYGDSLSWGIVPGTRARLAFAQRWPGALELALLRRGLEVRVIEDCLNGRRSAWDDPFKPGRNGLQGLAQRMEVHAPLALVLLMLGTNDFQSSHQNRAWHAAQGLAAVIGAMRQAPIEPGMVPASILLLAPPPIGTPQGSMAAKFEGAAERCQGLAAACQALAQELGCQFLDTGRVVRASRVDGVHLDADQHALLAQALTPVVAQCLAGAGTSAGA